MPDALPKAEHVRACALALGFDACAIASAQPIDPDNHLGEWLTRGYHADMDWLSQTQAVRQDIQRFLPGTRSVVVVARGYFLHDAATAGQCRVARYAQRRDYHNALRKPLQKLATFLDSLMPHAQSRCSLDSGPVLEKAWAVRAGLGWRGKNGLLIHRKLGSWQVLGVIATTVNLSPDPPHPAYCGRCRRCIDACPGQAIDEQGLVDSRRCVAYHTVENRGTIPESMREALGDWVFGCDICQEVCPWNRRVREATWPETGPSPAREPLTLEQWLELDEAGFQERFAKTPLRRAKLAGLQRTASILLLRQQRSR